MTTEDEPLHEAELTDPRSPDPDDLDPQFCHRCEEYVTEGRTDVDGLWVCEACLEEIRGTISLDGNDYARDADGRWGLIVNEEEVWGISPTLSAALDEIERLRKAVDELTCQVRL